MDESPEGVAWCCGSDVGLLSIDMKLFNDYVVLRTIRSSNLYQWGPSLLVIVELNMEPPKYYSDSTP